MEDNNINMYDERVGFGRRLGAYIIDIVAIAIFGSIVSSFVGNELAQFLFGSELGEMDSVLSMFGGSDMDMEGMMTKVYGFSAGTSLITLVMFIMEGSLGQSVGKMMLSIKISNEDLSQAKSNKLWIRSLLKYGSTLLSLLGGIIGLSFMGTIGSLWGVIIFIGFFFAFGDKKQTIHDMIAKTVVFRK